MAMSLLQLPTPTLACVAHTTPRNGALGVAFSDRLGTSGAKGQQQQEWKRPWRATGLVGRRGAAESVAGSGEVAVAVAGVGGVTEVYKETFWAFVEEAGEKVVVLDMYTQWCGPCKLMYPKVVKLSETYAGDVAFAKLDCNQDNKPLAKELGVKSVPTFKIFKHGQEVAEVRGAKYEELVRAIEKARSLSS